MSWTDELDERGAVWGSRGERAFQTEETAGAKADTHKVCGESQAVELPEHKTQIEQWKDIVIKKVSRG